MEITKTRLRFESLGLSRILGLFCAIAFVLRSLFPGMALDAVGPLAVVDALFGCILFAGFVVAAHKLGIFLTIRLFAPDSASLFMTVTRLGFGLGVLGSLTSILGFIGLYSSPWLGGILCTVLLITRGNPFAYISINFCTTIPERALLMLLGLLTTSVFLQGFAPQVDYSDFIPFFLLLRLPSSLERKTPDLF